MEVPVNFIGPAGTACANPDLPSRKKIRIKQDVERQRVDIRCILSMCDSIDCHAVVISDVGRAAKYGAFCLNRGIAAAIKTSQQAHYSHYACRRNEEE